MTGAGPYWPAHTKLVMSGSIRPKAGLQCGGVSPTDVKEKKRERDQSSEVRMSQQLTGGFSMESFMRMMAEMEASRYRRIEEVERYREEFERQREERRREDMAEQRQREERWREEMAEQRQKEREKQERILTQLQNQMTAMNRRVRTIADPVRSPMPTLLCLGSNALLEPFLDAFETQLTGSGVAADQWKYHLTGQIEDTHRAVLADQLAKEDCTYNDLVRGLGWLEAETTISAVERFFAAEVDGSKISNVTEALDVTVR